MKIKDISVGDIYYVQSKYDCTSCFKVKVVKVLNDKEIIVEGLTRSKRDRKKAKPFKMHISSLHKTAIKAVSGYKQHHKK